MDNTSGEIAVFGGGCFWCTEAVFKELPGVLSVMPGYTGGVIKSPTYEDVSSGRSGHAEVIRVEFEPEHISYEKLLDVFFAAHDPTTLNRQGNDVGTQYRSVIFYTNDDQREKAISFIAALGDAGGYSNPVVTTVEPLDTFYEAEDYHHNYYARNKTAPYCQLVIQPKLEKVKAHMTDSLQSVPPVDS